VSVVQQILIELHVVALCPVPGDGSIAKVPASNANGDFQAIVSNYITNTDTNAYSASNSRMLYGNKIGCWNVSLVTNMHHGFDNQETFNEPI